MEALGAASAILGLITGISGLIREWKAAPTALVASILIAGGVALFVVPANSNGGEDGETGSGGSLNSGGLTPTPSPSPDPEPIPEPAPESAPNQSPPPDPQSSEEYQVCVAYAGYGQWQCDPLLDEASGEYARADFRACVQDTQDAGGCVEAVYAKYGGY